MEIFSDVGGLHLHLRLLSHSSILVSPSNDQGKNWTRTSSTRTCPADIGSPTHVACTCTRTVALAFGLRWHSHFAIAFCSSCAFGGLSGWRYFGSSTLLQGCCLSSSSSSCTHLPQSSSSLIKRRFPVIADCHRSLAKLSHLSHGPLYQSESRPLLSGRLSLVDTDPRTAEPTVGCPQRCLPNCLSCTSYAISGCS